MKFEENKHYNINPWTNQNNFVLRNAKFIDVTYIYIPNLAFKVCKYELIYYTESNKNNKRNKYDWILRLLVISIILH